MKSPKITDEGLKELARLQQLTILSLENTKITDADLNEVDKLQTLYVLLLEDTQITEGGVVKLRRALPNWRIYGPQSRRLNPRETQ